MADVEKVETAVGQDDRLAQCFLGSDYPAQFGERLELVQFI
jgi:hypothetical protein